MNIHDTSLIHSDGNAIDNEGHSADSSGIVPPQTYLFKDNNLHDNRGTAHLCNEFVTAAAGDTLGIWDNNTFSANGGPGWAPPIVWGGRTTNTDPWYFTRNNIARGNAGQKVFGGGTTTIYSPTSDTPPTGKVFGASNTVHFP